MTGTRLEKHIDVSFEMSGAIKYQDRKKSLNLNYKTSYPGFAKERITWFQNYIGFKLKLRSWKLSDKN